MGENDAVDKWADWVIHRRDGDDAEQRQMDLEFLLPLRQRVLDNAQIVPGEIVLDVGAGDGLIAFGALDRVGEEGCVIVSDVSDDLLSHTRSLATEPGVEGRMSFVRAAAEDLSAIANASVDVVTTRSVLIYVNDKGRRVPSVPSSAEAGRSAFDLRADQQLLSPLARRVLGVRWRGRS
jgi:arsenite methyltransferase